MLTDAFHDCDAGFPVRYRFDGKLLNIIRFITKCKNDPSHIYLFISIGMTCIVFMSTVILYVSIDILFVDRLLQTAV